MISCPPAHGIPDSPVLTVERRISHEGMVSVGGNLYSVPDATRKTRRPRSSTRSCTMPSSSRSKARATVSAPMPTSSRRHHAATAAEAPRQTAEERSHRSLTG